MSDCPIPYTPDEILLIKNGELALKGLNRHTFEEALMRNLRYRLQRAGHFSLRCAQSTIVIAPKDADADLDEACDCVSRVFGIAGFSRARVAEKELSAIQAAAVEQLGAALSACRTFKVESKRSDKSFPLTSPQISREVGAYILERFPHLRVDVHHPDLQVTVEVRDFAAYVHGDQLPGAGGMPVGTGGRAMVLISGGIDSPVAAYMMAKRGVKLTAVHFASPPYTGERAEQKVVTLLERVSRYAGGMSMLVVPFTHVQEEIRRACPEQYFTLIMRRFMMRIAQAIAKDHGAKCLVTGENLGQVASQTMDAMAVTGAVVDIPMFHPLIGMDKEEIVTRARKIGTLETSILPYEDCCTVFTPKHPKTKPVLALVEAEEAKLDVDALVADALANTEKVAIRYYED